MIKTATATFLIAEDLGITMDQFSAPEPVLEIAVGTLILIVVIFVHGAGIRAINQRFSKSWIHVSSTTPHWRRPSSILIQVVIFAAMSYCFLGVPTG